MGVTVFPLALQYRRAFGSRFVVFCQKLQELQQSLNR